MRILHQCGIICLLLLPCSAQAQVQAQHQHADDRALPPAPPPLPRHGSSSASDRSTAKNAATCRSGTVNFITHTLPQQCATSSRPGLSLTAPSISRSADGKSEGSRVKTESVATDTLKEQVSVTLESIDQSSLPLSSSSITTTISSSATSTTADSVESQRTSQTSETTRDSTTTIETTTSTTLLSSTVTETEAETETDSPLDNAHFLSFEEWKKENLEKAGQSPEHVGQQSRSGNAKERSRPGINNALDVLGEDSEIELDFSGFGSGARADDVPHNRMVNDGQQTSQAVKLDKGSANTGLRSKDAGKTCKERTNYASFDCAATVVKSNKECKSASSVLIENKDSYMLNICTISNKFFIVELCDDILIDTVVLANYEFFSSIFRTFRLSVSDRFPVKDDRWRDLGVYEARNTRDVQAFLVEQPLIWARYLRIEFLTHYGSEYYCPVSLLRVHGTTMMEEFRHQEDIARGEYPEDAEVATTVEQEPEEASEVPEESVVESLPQIPAKTMEDASTSIAVSATADSNHGMPTPSVSPEIFALCPNSRIPEYFDSALLLDKTAAGVCLPDEASKHATTLKTSEASTTTSPPPRPSSTASEKLDSKKPKISTTTGAQKQHTVALPATNSTSTSGSTTSQQSSSGQVEASSGGVSGTSTSSTATNPTQSAKSASGSTKAIPASKASPQTQAGNGAAPAFDSSKPDSSRSPPSSSHSSPQPVPSTQESFFKSIHKRLQTLESNATLSLQYIESQSRILRDAFSKVERRQIRKTEDFLHTLNASVVRELEGFRAQYELLWQSTVLELESQRAGYEREIVAVSERLGVLAQEVVWQKRVGVVQSLLLLVCLGVVLFARVGSYGGGGDASALREIVDRGVRGRSKGGGSNSGGEQRALGIGGGFGGGGGRGGGGGGGARDRMWWISPPQSPSPETQSPNGELAGLGGHRLKRRWWGRSRSEAEVGTLSEDIGSADERPDTRDGPAAVGGTGAERPELMFQPPTPTSLAPETDRNGDGEAEEEEEEEEREGEEEEEEQVEKQSLDDKDNDNDHDAAVPQETQSSPSTPTGTRDSPLVALGREDLWPSRPRSPLGLG